MLGSLLASREAGTLAFFPCTKTSRTLAVRGPAFGPEGPSGPEREGLRFAMSSIPRDLRPRGGSAPNGQARMGEGTLVVICT